jgi:hypothetical protein
MGQQIMLSDLLKMSDTDLQRAKVRFNMFGGGESHLDHYRKDPESVNTEALLWRHSQKYFRVGELAVSLLKIGFDSWLLTTIKSITKDLEIRDGVNYEAEELAEFRPLYGRLVVKYHKSHQVQHRWLREVIGQMEVSQLLPSTFDGYDFPGYDRVRLNYSQLETIIDREKPDWINALKSQKAVYLITDLSDGKQYVGSATGDNMLLQRWRDYVSNGHGGNKRLEAIIKEKGFEHVKDCFQYSILENYNARVDDNLILERESWWKETLGTRAFGLNDN